MKKLAAVCFLMVSLTACNSDNNAMNRAMQLRSSILQAESCSFDSQITADYGDSIYSFSLFCQGDNQGNLFFTVREPDTIENISGSVSAEGGKLTFDDTALYFGVLTDEQLSPVSAPWILLKTLRSGCLTSSAMENELLHLSIDDSYEDNALNLDIWLNQENRPVRAEILYAGRRILSLDVTNFSVS